MVSEILFTFLRSASMISEAELAPLVQEFYASVVAPENQLRLLEQVPVDEDAR